MDCAPGTAGGLPMLDIQRCVVSTNTLIVVSFHVVVFVDIRTSNHVVHHEGVFAAHPVSAVVSVTVRRCQKYGGMREQNHRRGIVCVCDRKWLMCTTHTTLCVFEENDPSMRFHVCLGPIPSV